MSIARLCAFLIIAFLLVACATSSPIMTGEARTPIDPAQVKFYSTAPPVYEEIAAIAATSRSSDSFGDQKKWIRSSSG